MYQAESKTTKTGKDEIEITLANQHYPLDKAKANPDKDIKQAVEAIFALGAIFYRLHKSQEIAGEKPNSDINNFALVSDDGLAQATTSTLDTQEALNQAIHMPESITHIDPRFHGIEAVGLVRHLGRHDAAGIVELEKTIDRVKKINLSNGTMSVDKRAGFIFEEAHAGSFNAAARKVGDLKTTATTGGNGLSGIDDRVDIRITSGGKALKEAQAKCCRTPDRTAVSISKSQYTGTDRLVPSDQVDIVPVKLRASAAGKAKSGNARMREIGKNRAEAAGKVTDRLKAKGHESKPVTHQEAQDLAKGDLGKLNRTLVFESVTCAAKNGAKAGALFGGSFSAAVNLTALAKGEQDTETAVVNVVKDTAAGATRSASTAVVAEGVKYAAPKVLGKTIGKVVGKGSVPFVVANCMVETLVDGVNGELTTEKAIKNVGTSAAGWGGFEAGVMIGGACGGPIGAIIGGPLGALLAVTGFESFW